MINLNKIKVNNSSMNRIKQIIIKIKLTRYYNLMNKGLIITLKNNKAKRIRIKNKNPFKNKRMRKRK